MREIIFYRTELGDCPVEDFLDSLDGKQAQKVAWVMRLVEELDRIPEQYFKKLESAGNVWEIRAQLGSSAFRLLGFFDGSGNFIISHGFRKKTQKTPLREIELSEKHKCDYSKRR